MLTKSQLHVKQNLNVTVNQKLVWFTDMFCSNFSTFNISKLNFKIKNRPNLNCHVTCVHFHTRTLWTNLATKETTHIIKKHFQNLTTSLQCTKSLTTLLSCSFFRWWHHLLPYAGSNGEDRVLCDVGLLYESNQRALGCYPSSILELLCVQFIISLTETCLQFEIKISCKYGKTNPTHVTYIHKKTHTNCSMSYVWWC